MDIKGIEAGFAVRLPFDLTLRGNLTWQEGEKSDDPWDQDNALSRQLPDLPEVMANVSLNYDIKDRFWAAINLSYVDEREHFQNDSIVKLGDYTLINLSTAYRILKKKSYAMDLELVAENVF